MQVMSAGCGIDSFGDGRHRGFGRLAAVAAQLIDETKPATQRVEQEAEFRGLRGERGARRALYHDRLPRQLVVRGVLDKPAESGPNGVDPEQRQPLRATIRRGFVVVVVVVSTAMPRHIVEPTAGGHGVLELQVPQTRQHRRHDHVETAGVPIDLLQDAADDHRTRGMALDRTARVIRRQAVQTAREKRVEHQRTKTPGRHRHRSLSDRVRMAAVETRHPQHPSAVFQHDRPRVSVSPGEKAPPRDTVHADTALRRLAFPRVAALRRVAAADKVPEISFLVTPYASDDTAQR